MTNTLQNPADHTAALAFIEKWRGVKASELSASQSFLIDLCQLLGVETPHPTPAQDYMFERPITFQHGDGSRSAGRIDLYRRGAFVLESKKLKAGAHTKGFDEAMLRARSQAENYARALPADEGRPPFVLVVDVGQRIELYSEFSRSGGTYTPFPDPRHYRIALDDLADPAIRERLRAIWLDPLSLDPSRESARVTREIAAQLAELAKSLEHSGHNAEAVAQFLMRCLFTMFAEDVRLLPPDALRNLLISHREKPDIAMRMLGQLWRDMDGGGFSAVLADDVLRFNGKLFKQPETLPLNTAQIDLLIEAAKADWQHVEPAIFGTLLERALNPQERHKLGAHYTPRAYVERLVLPTVIEPLRQEWGQAHVAALALASEGNEKEAIAQLLRFHQRLCTVRVLDPACGSGNFLYVTLEHLKRLEGEVLNTLDEMGYRQTGLALDGERADAAAGETVDPHNLLGIELNPRAAAIAEVVLWIGYLQWHFRTRGDVNPPAPVIRDFRNIENRDAVLACERVDYVLDEQGKPVTRWDGKTTKISPVTGEAIPDETARVPLEHYINPSKAEWPEADFVVGNPPFIGAATMRRALGDGYVDALRNTWPEVPESADLVMYWWHYAAQLTVQGQLQGFGFITTNSIRQTFNRRVIEAAMQPDKLPSPPPPLPKGEGSEKPSHFGRLEQEKPFRRLEQEKPFRRLEQEKPSPLGRGLGEGALGSSLPPGEGFISSSPLPLGEGAGVRAKKPLPRETLAFARQLRQQATDAENKLWMLLRDRRLHGMKFRRQHPCPPYTLDFYCHALALAVELDGSQHLNAERDAKRDAFLAEKGIKTLRYWNHDVLARTDAVLEDLWGKIDAVLMEKDPSALTPNSLTPNPSPKGRGEPKAPSPNPLPEGEGFISSSPLPAGEGFISPSPLPRGEDFISNSPLPLGEGSGVRVKKKMEIKPLVLAFAIPDHPWVDGADGAAVRIAMTVGACNSAGEGKLLRVESETPSGDGEVHVELAKQRGLIQQDLRIGADVASACALRANENISNRGFCLFGAGFIVTEAQAAALGLGQVPGMEQVIRPYRNGRDLTAAPRGVRVIDLFGLSVEQARQRYPAVYQHVLERVKPERDVNKRESRRRNWWIFGEPNPKLREQLKDLPRYIVTVETAKHRLFQFLDAAIAPDNKLVAIALDDAAALGILSSAVHITWALAAGGNLGVGNDPVYVKSRCFECFPFPDMANAGSVRQLAEQLDAHRKQQQALHPGLTLTGMYNVLEKLRSGEALTGKERTVHEQGVVSVLRQLHDELDAAVLQAYGWSDLLPLLRIAHGNDTPQSPNRMEAKRAFDEAVLERLVALNAQRAAEESRGQIRWLRPALQNPGTQTTRVADSAEVAETADDSAASPPKAGTRPWPKDPVEQVQAILQVLAESPAALDAEHIASRFKGRGTWRKQLPALLAMLAALGHVHDRDGGYRCG